MHEKTQKLDLSATTRGYFVAKIARLDDVFSQVFEREASTVELQSLQQKDKKRQRKSKNVVKRDASEKKAFFHVANAFLSRSEPILAHFKARKLRNVQKPRF